MRPVAPLDLPGLNPADLTGQPGPDFDLVAPSDLHIDEAYQRRLSQKSIALIRRIVEGWCWAKFKPPICVKVDGKLHVIDGQHTAIAAATHGGISILPVVVVAAPELTDRAKAFVSHATNRLQATPTQIWHAAAAAGDEDALTIRNVCSRAGVELVAFPPASSAYKPGQTIALAAIKRLIDRRGALRAREVLEALVKADLAPIGADMIKAAEALLCDDEYRSEFDAERVTATIKGLGSRACAEAREISIAKHLPTWRALVAVMFKHRKRAAKPDKAIDEPEPPRAGPGPVRMTSPMIRPSYMPGPTPTFGDPEPGRSALDQRSAAV